MRIAIVGTCASGKSTIVAALRERGLDAYAVAQEHSAIPGLWRHLEPDKLVLLQVDLPAVRHRRGDPNWPEWIYSVQRARLSDAESHADIVIDTTDLDIDQTVAQIIEAVQCD